MAPRPTPTPTPETTTLDSDTTAPSVTAPGDGPADTTDPTERASSRVAQPGDDAVAVGTVNSVVPVPAPPVDGDAEKPKDRIETYPARRPDGSLVTVTHNIDTGETSVS